MINFLKIALRVYNSFPITVCGELGFRIIVSGKGNAQSWNSRVKWIPVPGSGFTLKLESEF